MARAGEWLYPNILIGRLFGAHARSSDSRPWSDTRPRQAWALSVVERGAPGSRAPIGRLNPRPCLVGLGPSCLEGHDVTDLPARKPRPPVPLQPQHEYRETSTNRDSHIFYRLCMCMCVRARAFVRVCVHIYVYICLCGYINPSSGSLSLSICLLTASPSRTWNT